MGAWQSSHEQIHAPTGQELVMLPFQLQATDKNALPQPGNLKAPCSRGRKCLNVYHFLISMSHVRFQVSAQSQCLYCRFCAYLQGCAMVTFFMLLYVLRRMPFIHVVGLVCQRRIKIKTKKEQHCQRRVVLRCRISALLL